MNDSRAQSAAPRRSTPSARRPRPVRRTLLQLALGALVALVLAPAPSPAQDFACSDCHEEQLSEASVHAIFGCVDCHSGIDDYPHPEEMLRGDQVCAQCHEAGDERDQSIHAGLADCASCHGAAHEVLAVADPGSPVSPTRQLETCGTCHETETILSFERSSHGQALLGAGLLEAAPSCSDCHGAHLILPPEEPESRLSNRSSPETCGSCHLEVTRVWTEESAHGAAWQAGVENAPACTSCHLSHPEIPEDGARVAGIAPARLAVPETCNQCHQEEYDTYRHGFHGQVTSLGLARSAVCSDCHPPHANLPASDPRSSIHPDNLAATCGTCHQNVNANFLTFDPHADPSDREANPKIWTVWFAMSLLLIGVFGFFGLHDLLWLQRSVVALARGEIARDTPDGPYVKRFERVHIGTHLVVILTFLALAATGLPLYFHDTGWAQALGQVPFGIVVARFVHRLAGALTFGYFLFHLGWLLYRALVRRDQGLLYGWKSMVPRPKDVRDFVANVRYFLYLGRRPAFDRYTYWEKFDYFAVFWGVAIIGFSGLMLWFPTWFTQWLPGWVLNAAFVVHSEEALLATGFIFLFHFFHTHMRPESFPMDPVIFTGRMPLERFREERPEEYRRLVDSGELDALLVPPPSARQRRLALIFGLSAVAVGLLLFVGIVVGVFTH